jgi:adenosylcobinamide-phosphate synthase
MLLLIVLVFPFVLLAGVATSYFFGIFLLYVALGARALFEHGARVMQSLQQGDLDRARNDVGMMVSRNLEEMTSQQVSRAAI